MFQKRTEGGYTLAVPGIERKTLVHGERTLMTEFLLKKAVNYLNIPTPTSRPVTSSMAAFVFQSARKQTT